MVIWADIVATLLVLSGSAGYNGRRARILPASRPAVGPACHNRAHDKSRRAAGRDLHGARGGGDARPAARARRGGRAGVYLPLGRAAPAAVLLAADGRRA